MENTLMKDDYIIKNYIRAAYAFLPDEYHLGSIEYINTVREIEKESLLGLRDLLIKNNNYLGKYLYALSPDSADKELFIALVNFYQAFIWEVDEKDGNRDPQVILDKFNYLGREYGPTEYFMVYISAIQHYMGRLRDEFLADVKSV